MPDFVLENFKNGLDARKSELTSVVGTLGQANNCHVNQGGEIEKRKAFVRTALPTNSFGGLGTSAGLTVFGSVASGSLSLALPMGVTYQRLQHPDGSTAMTAVVCQTVFGGKAFVVAKFSDGNIYAYYNGTLVEDFIAGEVLTSQNTNEKINAALAALVNSTASYTSTDNGNSTQDVVSLPGTQYTTNITKTSTLGTLAAQVENLGVPPNTAIASVGQFAIQAGSSNPGTNKITSVKVGATQLLSASVDWTTSNPNTAALIATNINGYTSGYTATANGNTVIISGSTSAGATPNGSAVQVTAAGNVIIGVLSFTLGLIQGSTQFTTGTTVLVNGVSIQSSAVNWNTSVSQTCADIVSNINAYFGTSGYNAYSSGQVIYLSKLITTSTDAPVNVIVNVGTGGEVIFGTAQGMAVSISPISVAIHDILLQFTNGVRVEGGVGYSANVTITVTGGIGPYTYQWSEVPPGTGGAVMCGLPNSATTYFQSSYAVDGGLLTTNFVCTVTDAQGSTIVSSPIAVLVTASF